MLAHLLAGLNRVTLSRNVIAVEDRPCAMSRDLHGALFGDAGENHVSDCRASGIVKISSATPASFRAGFEAGSDAFQLLSVVLEQVRAVRIPLREDDLDHRSHLRMVDRDGVRLLILGVFAAIPMPFMARRASRITLLTLPSPLKNRLIRMFTSTSMVLMLVTIWPTS